MLLQILKSLQQTLNSTKRERLLFLENQELICENISLKKELELKNKALKNLPVEFKNHITSLIGFSEMLLQQQQNKLTDKQKQYLSNIIETAGFLNNTVNDMLCIP